MMDNTLGLGKSSASGERGITKRLDALGGRPICLAAIYWTSAAATDLHGAAGRRFRQGRRYRHQEDRLALFAERLKDTALAERVTVRSISTAELDYPDDSFDLVTAIEVMEHRLHDAVVRPLRHRPARPDGHRPDRALTPELFRHGLGRHCRRLR